MPVDPRDQLWDVVYETWYDSYYEELLADALITRWLRLDEFTKVVVALTSSGSAVAGFALWKTPDLTWLWPTLGGVSAVLAIVTERLAVAFKLRDHGATMRAFASIRIDLDTLRAKMRVNPNFDMAALEQEYLTLRKRYGEAYSGIKSDILATQSLEQRVQADLNQRLT
jgi:hypothetical protein